MLVPLVKKVFAPAKCWWEPTPNPLPAVALALDPRLVGLCWEGCGMEFYYWIYLALGFSLLTPLTAAVDWLEYEADAAVPCSCRLCFWPY